MCNYWNVNYWFEISVGFTLISGVRWLFSSACIVITVRATPALGPAQMPKSGSVVKVTGT
jgi:hypothetical protein